MTTPYRPPQFIPRGWKVAALRLAIPVADGATAAVVPPAVLVELPVTAPATAASAAMLPVSILNTVQFGIAVIPGGGDAVIAPPALIIAAASAAEPASAASDLTAPSVSIFFPVTIASVAPSSGHYDTTVTITGSGFVPGDTSVTIGGQPARNVTVVNSTTITCTPPALPNGAYAVAVTTSQTSASAPAAFTYAFTMVEDRGVARSSYPLPTGWQSITVKTVQGAGGAGGEGYQAVEGTLRRGGGGGGGGGRIEEITIPRGDYPTAVSYDVVNGAGASGSNGGSSVFRLRDAGGNVLLQLLASGGAKGGDASSSAVGAAGTGGSGSASGIAATVRTGRNGGAGGSGAGSAGANASSATGAPGGGGGGARSASNVNSQGGAGGSMTGVSAGSAGVNTHGGTGGNGNANDPPMGGGGGGAAGLYQGGKGGTYGAGSGGSGGSYSVYASMAGANGHVWLQIN